MEIIGNRRKSIFYIMQWKDCNYYIPNMQISSMRIILLRTFLVQVFGLCVFGRESRRSDENYDIYTLTC